MKVALCFPPGWDPIQPYLSLPALAAYVKQAGHEVFLHDLNLEFYDYITSAEGIKHAYEVGEIHKYSPDNEQESVLWSIKEPLLKEIDFAKRVLRSQDFFDKERRERALRILDIALQVQTLAYPKIEVSLQRISIDGNKFDHDSISQLVTDESSTPFGSWYRGDFITQLKRQEPRLVGISLVNYDQLIPTLILAKQIKEALPGVHIVLGGDIATRLAQAILEHPSLIRFIDSVICHEGEAALLSLITKMESGDDSPIGDLPNLYLRDENGFAKSTRIAPPLNMEMLPVPDFSGLPLDGYFAPHLVLPIESSRGCYWGRCTFCEEVGKSYRTKTGTKLAAEVKELKSDFQTDYFALTDSCTSPKFIKDFSLELTRHHTAIVWRALIRAERAFDRPTVELAYAAGCRMVMIGIESGSPRISSLMEKGLDVYESDPVLQIFHDSGVWVHCFLMMGFPTERFDEALATVEFVSRSRNKISSVGMSEFVAPRGTPIFEQMKALPVFIMENTQNPWALHFTKMEGEMLSRETKLDIWKTFHSAMRSLDTDPNAWLQMHINQLFLQIVQRGAGFRATQEISLKASAQDL